MALGMRGRSPVASGPREQARAGGKRQLDRAVAAGPGSIYNGDDMPILLIFFGLLVPRVVLVLAGLGGTFAGVWQSMLWPVLGFLFMPYTTLAYGMAHAYGGGLHGVWLALLIVGVCLDMGASGESARRGRRRRAS